MKKLLLLFFALPLVSFCGTQATKEYVDRMRYTAVTDSVATVKRVLPEIAYPIITQTVEEVAIPIVGTVASNAAPSVVTNIVTDLAPLIVTDLVTGIAYDVTTNIVTNTVAKVMPEVISNALEGITITNKLQDQYFIKESITRYIISSNSSQAINGDLEIRNVSFSSKWEKQPTGYYAWGKLRDESGNIYEYVDSATSGYRYYNRYKKVGGSEETVGTGSGLRYKGGVNCSFGTRTGYYGSMVVYDESGNSISPSVTMSEQNQNILNSGSEISVGDKKISVLGGYSIGENVLDLIVTTNSIRKYIPDDNTNRIECLYPLNRSSETGVGFISGDLTVRNSQSNVIDLIATTSDVNTAMIDLQQKYESILNMAFSRDRTSYSSLGNYSIYTGRCSIVTTNIRETAQSAESWDAPKGFVSNIGESYFIDSVKKISTSSSQRCFVYKNVKYPDEPILEIDTITRGVLYYCQHGFSYSVLNYNKFSGVSFFYPSGNDIWFSYSYKQIPYEVLFYPSNGDEISFNPIFNDDRSYAFAVNIGTSLAARTINYTSFSDKMKSRYSVEITDNYGYITIYAATFIGKDYWGPGGNIDGEEVYGFAFTSTIPSNYWYSSDNVKLFYAPRTGKFILHCNPDQMGKWENIVKGELDTLYFFPRRVRCQMRSTSSSPWFKMEIRRMNEDSTIISY